MAVLIMVELPGVTTADYDALNERLGIHGEEDVPDGLIQHLAGETNDGLLIVDVWESEEQFRRFFERVGEAMAATGAPPAHPRILPVHNLIRQGGGSDANVILVIEAADLTPQRYDEVAARMPEHVAGGADHPAVSHAAATTSGGMVFVDVWDSPESFRRFADRQRSTAAVDVDLSRLEPRFVPLHNRFAE
jgi:hypothetical protein